jgi:beta-lactamase class A
MKRIVLLFLLFIFIILICSTLPHSSREKIKTENKLHKAMIDPLFGAKGKYSVVVNDLTSNEGESLYGNKYYQVGSLYKLWVMAEVFNQIKKGKISEEEMLSEDVVILNNDFNIDPEMAELTEGTITLTVKEALKQMIAISHNYAALLLTKKVGISNVSIFLKTNGLISSHVGDTPISTADDIALFFEKLYKSELNSPKYTAKMLDLLKQQQLNEKLPKYLPKGTVVAHKTGEIGFLSHDAGIVYTKNRNYIIVVLSETNSPPGAMERIAKISKSVFDYFSGY